MAQTLYVWTRSLRQDGKAVVVGRLSLDNGIGQFVYGRSYLARPDSFALDPINLPLEERVFTFQHNGGIPGVISDAGPDAWGRATIAALTGTTQPLDILLHGNGHGVGGLVFSKSADHMPRQTTPPLVNSLDAIELALEKLQQGHIAELTTEERLLLAQGSSIGGARPKVAFEYQGKEYIAKINQPQDAFDHARVEHATMTLAAKVGIDVPETRVIKAGNSCLYLVARFDRRQGYRHYLSAASLFNRYSLRPSDFSGSYSYPGLAQLTTKISQDIYAQQAALFRRMVFNFFMHNTDDHARNHGFLMVAPDNLALSPAFDLLPHLNADEHALGLGTEGRTATLANCLSRCEQFGLNHKQAKNIGEEVLCTIRGWKDHFQGLGVEDKDLLLLQKVINSRLADPNQS